MVDVLVDIAATRSSGVASTSRAWISTATFLVLRYVSVSVVSSTIVHTWEVLFVHFFSWRRRSPLIVLFAILVRLGYIVVSSALLRPFFRLLSISAYVLSTLWFLFLLLTAKQVSKSPFHTMALSLPFCFMFSILDFSPLHLIACTRMLLMALKSLVTIVPLIL